MAVQTDNVRPLRRPVGEISAPGRRWRTNWPAELAIGSSSRVCAVQDISCWGAKLRLDSPPAQGSAVVLVIENIGRIEAEVVWCQPQQLGLRFREPQLWVERLHLRQLEPASWGPQR